MKENPKKRFTNPEISCIVIVCLARSAENGDGFKGNAYYKEKLMKTNKSLFYITLIALALFYALTCGFAATSVKAPQTAFSTVKVELTDGGKISPSKSSNVTLDVEKGTKKVYAYVGEIRSSKTDADGNSYVNIIFDFKMRSGDDTHFSERVGDDENGRIYVNHGSGGYKWTLIYDGEKASSYDRVKISTVDEMDIYEVAFVDKDGNVLRAEYKYGSDIGSETGHANICDESSSFTASKSKANNFTDKELEEIAAVKTVMRNQGRSFGQGILNAELNALSVAVFGLNTFGLRFPSLLAGFAALIAVYLIVDLLFGNARLSVFALLVCLTCGSIFAASLTACNSISACFAVYAFYFAMKFFVEDYYVEDRESAIIHIGLSGLFFGLSVAANASLLVLISGLGAIVGYAAVRGAKRYKEDEKAAKGLEKEDVYVAYRGKKIFYFVSVACSFVVLPIIILLVSYAFVGSALAKAYRGGFIGGAFAFIGSSFGFGESVIPVKLLAGFGSENLGGGYFAFANYFTSALCLVSLAFIIIALVLNKKEKIGNALGRSANKTKLILTAFVSAFVALTFGKGDFATDFALCSAFYSLVAALALHLAVRIFGEKIKTVATVLVCVCLAAFAMNYVGYAGIAVSETAKNVLYGWQI